MKALLIVFDTSLTRAQLRDRREKLAAALAKESIELKTLRVGDDLGSIVTHLLLHAKGAPVIVVDDRHALPGDAPWLAELSRGLIDLTPDRRPQLIYLTEHITAAGKVQAADHGVVRAYIQRDGQDAWIGQVAAISAGLASQFEDAGQGAAAGFPPATEFVGESRCFCEAVEGLRGLMRSPYGLVTGPRGAGKIFLIRATWRRHHPGGRFYVLPCGSFFKDYYVAGGLRRIGGGREAVDQLTPCLKESRGGLLVLHHVEELPTALQEELDARLAAATENPDGSLRLVGLDSAGPVDYDLKIIATSTSPPELLVRTRQVLPELLARLRQRHVPIPSLADRSPEDVLLLCEDILRRIAARQGIAPAPKIEPDAVHALSWRVWPGNISDLVRVLERALRHSQGTTIGLADVAESVPSETLTGTMPTLDEVVARAQRTAIQHALDLNDGNVAAAAAALGRNRGSLHRLMRNLGMATKRRARVKPK